MSSPVRVLLWTVLWTAFIAYALYVGMNTECNTDCSFLMEAPIAILLGFVAAAVVLTVTRRGRDRRG